MSSSTVSPAYLERPCCCNWGSECCILKKLLCEAGDVLLTRMIRIRPGTSETMIALNRSVVEFIFRLGPEYDDANIDIAAYHWAPPLISRNYIGSKKNRPSRQFKCLLTRSKAISYDCSMDARSNNFQACMQRAGVAIDKTDERRLLFVLHKGAFSSCSIQSPSCSNKAVRGMQVRL